jgi:hypothetical protein
LAVRPMQQGPPTLEGVAYGDAFPDLPAEFVHDLHHDGRLTLDAIADLADRLPRSAAIYDTAAQPLLVPHGGPPRGELARPGDVIRDLGTANAWLTMLNVDQDPEYADLMNSTLDRLEEGMIGRQGKMRNRAAFIFLSSPNSVTPAHFDIEHSLLMQLRGSKTVSIGGFVDEAARRHEVERYWDGSHGRVETMPQKLASSCLVPGRGVYLPPVVPHWVHNGPDVSVSITLTYFTSSTVRENRIEDFNSLLRRWHMKPRPAGRSPTTDTAKVIAMGGLAVSRRLRARLGAGTSSEGREDQGPIGRSG